MLEKVMLVCAGLFVSSSLACPRRRGIRNSKADIEGRRGGVVIRFPPKTQKSELRVRPQTSSVAVSNGYPGIKRWQVPTKSPSRAPSEALNG